MAAAVLNTVDTLSHSPVDSGSGTLRHKGCRSSLSSLPLLSLDSACTHGSPAPINRAGLSILKERERNGSVYLYSVE
jgi:hypothetical protein